MAQRIIKPTSKTSYSRTSKNTPPDRGNRESGPADHIANSAKNGEGRYYQQRNPKWEDDFDPSKVKCEFRYDIESLPRGFSGFPRFPGRRGHRRFVGKSLRFVQEGPFLKAHLTPGFLNTERRKESEYKNQGDRDVRALGNGPDSHNAIQFQNQLSVGHRVISIGVGIEAFCTKCT